MKDTMTGKTRNTERTKKLGGKSIAKSGLRAARRTVGLVGGIYTYVRYELGIIENNSSHGVRKPKDVVRKRRLADWNGQRRTLGRQSGAARLYAAIEAEAPSE
jgi:hypothetical protein